MGSSYRIIVPGDDPKASELRLGYYMSGDDGFPPNYADVGDITETTGVLMTTKGQYALAAAEAAFVQSGKGIAVQVAGDSGGWALEATDNLSLTAKSIYLQSARPVSTESPAAAVTEGHVSISTDNDFVAYSHEDDVRIVCSAGGYRTQMTSGWLHIDGNQSELSNTDVSIKLKDTVVVPIAWNFNYYSYYCFIRGSQTVFAFNKSEGAFLKATATGVAYNRHQVWSGIKGVGTRLALLVSRSNDLESGNSGTESEDEVIQIRTRSIESDISGVSSDINAVQELNSE